MLSLKSSLNGITLLRLFKIKLSIAVLITTSFLNSCSLHPKVLNTSELSRFHTTKEGILEWWGKPDYVNYSLGTWGEREQWIYKCLKFDDCDCDCFYNAHCVYLYFENGKLTSWYDTR